MVEQFAKRSSSVLNSSLTDSEISSGVGTSGAFVKSVTVSVRFTLDKVPSGDKRLEISTSILSSSGVNSILTWSAISVGVGTLGALVRVVVVSTRVTLARVPVESRRLEIFASIRDSSVLNSVRICAAVGLPESCVSRLALARPMAARISAAVIAAVPVVLSTGTPLKTLAAGGTAQVPVSSLLGP